MIKRKITINDLAKITGFSKSTVSFALNDSNKIKEETKDCILKKANDLGYIPDPSARNFSLKRQNSIGFLLPQKVEYTMQNPNIIGVLYSSLKICQEKGYTLKVIPPLNKSVSLAIKNAAVDGIIGFGIYEQSPIAKILETRCLPFVTIDGYLDDNIYSANIDDEQAGYDLMNYVLSCGHREIAVVSFTKAIYGTTKELEGGIQRRRLDGFQKALREYKLDPESLKIYYCENWKKGADELTQKILKSEKIPTVIVGMNSVVIGHMMNNFKKAGYKIPKDISFCSFDNTCLNDLSSPKLTYISQDSENKSEWAINCLFDLIQGISPKILKKQFKHKLVIRESVRNLTK